MKIPAMEYQIEAGKPRLFSFRFLPDPGQNELLIWFWDGYSLIINWFKDVDFSAEYYDLPKVQEFLLSFALLAKDAFRRTLDADRVYAFLRLCEDTHDAILDQYRRPR